MTEPARTTRVIDDISAAAAALRSGLLVAFPTETVYGLGVDATNPAAVSRLFQAKGRPCDNPLIVHLADPDHWPRAAAELSESAARLMREFSPGPLTVVAKKSPTIVDAVTAGLDTVGIRIPKHDLALSLLRQCDTPIAAPSANVSGRPSCTTWQSVLEDMQGRVDFILTGDVCAIGIESTVVDCTSDPARLLRSGAVTREQILEILPSLILSPIESADAIPLSPGMRHPHYQPNAAVILIESPEELLKLPHVDLALTAFAGLQPQSLMLSCEHHPSMPPMVMKSVFDSVESYMQNFYEFLREADRRGAKKIALQIAPNIGVGAALRDRQLRAAGKITQNQ